MNQFQIKQKILVIRMPRELDHHSAELIRMEADRLVAQKNLIFGIQILWTVPGSG